MDLSAFPGCNFFRVEVRPNWVLPSVSWLAAPCAAAQQKGLPIVHVCPCNAKVVVQSTPPQLRQHSPAPSRRRSSGRGACKR